MIRKTLEHLATSVDDGVLAGSHLIMLDINRI